MNMNESKGYPAQYDGTCARCKVEIFRGDYIVMHAGQWAHVDCDTTPFMEIEERSPAPRNNFEPRTRFKRGRFRNRLFATVARTF